MNMPYHGVIRTIHSTLALLWKEPWVRMQSMGVTDLWSLLQSTGAGWVLTQSHPSHCNLSSTARCLFLNFDREMAVQINCNSSNALYLQCFYYYYNYYYYDYCYIWSWRWNPGPWACYVLSSTTEPQSQPLDIWNLMHSKTLGYLPNRPVKLA